MSKNFNIAATPINLFVRVSSAAIWYEAEDRFQIETIIFSDDSKQNFRMWIHGSRHGEIDSIDPMLSYAKTFHGRIVRLLVKKLAPDNTLSTE